jgi:cytochrome c553
MADAKNLRSVQWFLWVGFIMSFSSCVHELPQPGPDGGGDLPPQTNTNCSADTVYFEQNILPLVTTLCGKSGCHGPVKHNSFQLVYPGVTTSYNAIKNRFVSSSNPASYAKLENVLHEMAEQNKSAYVEPNTQQLSTLKTWISQGAKLNSCISCDTTQFTFTANIIPLLSTYCIGCHPSPGSSNIPNLTTYSAVQSELINYPGRLLGSIQHVAPYNTQTTAMPQYGAKLSDCSITQVQKWIQAGAQNN